jgi:histone H3/H4
VKKRLKRNRRKSKMGIVIKSQIRPLIKELDKENAISSVADEVAIALDKKVEDILVNAIERAKANKRRTIQARDL